MKHTRLEVGAEWIKQGGRPDKVLEAIAVAEAESGLSDEASSSCCHGVWALHTMHTPMSCSRKLPCATKRAVELSKKGTDWSAWVVHPDGVALAAYDPNQPQAVKNYEKALASIKADKTLAKLPLILPGVGADALEWLGGAAGDTADAVGNVAGGIPEAISYVGDILAEIAQFAKGAGELLLTPEGWKRLAMILGGGTFILIGLNAVMNAGYGVNPAGTAKKVGVKVATKGAV